MPETAQTPTSRASSWRRKPLVRTLFMTNHAVLFACISMYFGTGWSLVLFNFVIRPEMTVDNYYTHFVPQIEAAIAFFTYMTVVMIVTAGIMIVGEWKTYFRWVAIFLLVAIFASTGMEMFFIMPYNDLMREGISDPAVLEDTLGKWMAWNRARLGIWTVEWLAMMGYFALKAHGVEARR